MTVAARDFSVVRRRKNYVDIITPKRAGVKGYRLRSAANFDGVFADLLTADIGSGFLDPKINPSVIHAINNPNHIRIIFNPSNFSLDDDQHLWLKFQPVDFGGTPGTEGPPHLILPDDEVQAAGRVAITGAAPNAADVNSSLQINLPFGMRDIVIKNNSASGGTILYVATALGGAERAVAGQESFVLSEGSQPFLFVRGGGGTANFTANFTHYLPR